MSVIGITGINGFVGKQLALYLKTHTKFTLKQINLREEVNEETLNSVRTVVHLAGKAHDLKKTSAPQEYYQVNFELTKRLFDLFLVSDAEVFIFISSVKAVADFVEGRLTEDFIPNPQTDYGKSKLMAEQYIANQSLPPGKSYYIIRPCMIHGPGNKGNLNLLYNFVKKNIPYPLAKFANRRSFLSVENLCFVISELIAAKNVHSGVYNMADDDAISTNRLIELISISIGKKPKLWYIPASIIKTLARIGDVVKLPINTERLHKLTENYIVDNSKIKDALKEKLPVTTEKGIETTIKSFANYN